MKLEVSRKSFEKYSDIKIHEKCPVGAELFHEEGRMGSKTEGHTYMTKLIVVLRNFAKASN
jgi:hypothetical protein